MAKLELEVKILNIDEKDFISKIEKLGAVLKEENNQYLYTYDLPTIYGRYIDLLLQLNHPESNIKYETSLSKLKLLFFEVDNLLNAETKKELLDIFHINCLAELLNKDNILEILNQREFNHFMKQYHNNDKKWIRLRQTNHKTTIAVKHILANNQSDIQQMLETEIEVPSLKEGNELLEALGYSYKSYQEKRRITYIFEEHEIDIDTWPLIPTYFEVEGKNREDLEEILKKLGYQIEDTVSCTADEIYRMYGKSMFDNRMLKF